MCDRRADCFRYVDRGQQRHRLRVLNEDTKDLFGQLALDFQTAGPGARPGGADQPVSRRQIEKVAAGAFQPVLNQFYVCHDRCAPWRPILRRFSSAVKLCTT